MVIQGSNADVTKNSLNRNILSIVDRALPGGGFPYQKGGACRVDQTAWAVLAFKAHGVYEDLSFSARSRLSQNQQKDGRVPISSYYPDAFWPTPLAVLAWQDSPEHDTFQRLGIDFLLSSTGEHWKKGLDSPFGHDPSIQGWPWIEKTHSWVEPTSLALLALEATGNAGHPRAREAIRMLLDRQIESGGWNYGNTTVFGRRLRPMPESTGMALSALRGKVRQKDVETSIAYLKAEAGRLQTPLSLGWSIMGLSAWGERSSNVGASVLKCLGLQGDYGPFSTGEIALLLVSLKAETGLLSIFTREA